MFNARLARCASLPLALLAFAMVACAPGLHSVRVRTADGRERTTAPQPRPPVAISEEEFQHTTASLARDIVPVEDPLEFARQRFEVPARSGWFFYDRRTKRIAPLDPAAAADLLPPDVVELTHSYLQWCHSRQEPGDCLRLLRHGYALDAHGRYALAMAIALGSVLYETRASLVGMTNPVELEAMLLGAMTMYLMLWALPEPVSKGIAAIMTASLVVYLGVDTLYSLGRGWKALIDRADMATTFDELRAAGERFGKVMGANTARIMVMLATAALGSQSGALVKAAPNLPQAAQASRFAATEGGVTLAAVGAVESVTIAESGLTLTLAPGAVAMSVTGSNSGGSDPGARPSVSKSRGQRAGSGAGSGSSRAGPTPTRPYPTGNGTEPPEPGWQWRGPDAPGGPRGGWVNPNNPGESLHPDLGHGGPDGPHWDWNLPGGERFRIFPDGTVVAK